MINVNAPVVFVDVMGPLITRCNMRVGVSKEKSPFLNPMACDNLQRLIDRTGAHVVFSSILCGHTLGMTEVFNFFFNSNYNIPFIGMTKPNKDGWREFEILDWLDAHYVAHDCFVVLDDDVVDNNSIDDHLVAINPNYGIKDKDVEKAIKIIEKFRPSLDEVKDLPALERLAKFKAKRRRK